MATQEGGRVAMKLAVSNGLIGMGVGCVSGLIVKLVNDNSHNKLKEYYTKEQAKFDAQVAKYNAQRNELEALTAAEDA